MSYADEHNDDLENLFRQEFDGWEADASSSSWDNIADALVEDKPGFLSAKMGAIEMPVSTSVWENIEAELHKKRRIIPIWWQWGAVASILLAVGLFYLSRDSGSFYEEQLAEKVEPVNKINESNKQNETEEVLTTNVIEEEQDADNDEIKVPPVIDNYYVSASTSSNSSNSVLASDVAVLDEVEDVLETFIQDMELLETDRLLASLDEVDILDRIPFMSYRWDIKKRPDGTSLIGGIGGNNGGEATGNGNVGAVENTDGIASGLGSNNDYSISSVEKVDGNQLVYATPFKLNFTVQKGITERLAFETGLSYTMIAAAGENDVWSVNSKLHYIGVPLRTTFKLYEKMKVQFYSNQGFLLEKGLYQNISHSDGSSSIDDKGYIRGSQVSVELGLGANYDLNNKLGLYLQGGVSYYIKKDKQQPYNIYNGNSLWPSVVAGLRYKLK